MTHGQPCPRCDAAHTSSLEIARCAEKAYPSTGTRPAGSQAYTARELDAIRQGSKAAKK